MKILLLSTYELGHQPLGLARPAAYLSAAGHAVRCQDLAIDRLDEALVRDAELVAISVPMHTATRLAVRVAERVRALNARCHVCFYGLYASLHADVLLGPANDHGLANDPGPADGESTVDGHRPGLADSVIGGEFELPLVELAANLARSEPPDRLASVNGVRTRDADGGVFLGRFDALLPRRDLLPPLERYARVASGPERRVVGYVEASRGCAHRCLHCPITPVYGGRLRIATADVVLDDIRQLVALGAEHITFGDPDFFNGIRHSLRIVEAIHAEHPGLTFDATIKVEHILEHRRQIPTLAASGCLFIVSAVEAVQDHVLANFQKGHSRADIVEALAITRSAGIPIRPTFVAFTPWTTLDDYLELLHFVERHDLLYHVDPIQLAIRLLVPRGSSLIGTAAMEPFLGPFDETTFSYTWRHPDPRMDRLQGEVSGVVAQAARAGEDAAATFDRVSALAHRAADRPVRSPAVLHRAPTATVPRLTEPWFC